jgi:hypothetical protein
VDAPLTSWVAAIGYHIAVASVDTARCFFGCFAVTIFRLYCFPNFTTSFPMQFDLEDLITKSSFIKHTNLSFGRLRVHGNDEHLQSLNWIQIS